MFLVSERGEGVMLVRNDRSEVVAQARSDRRTIQKTAGLACELNVSK